MQKTGQKRPNTPKSVASGCTTADDHWQKSVNEIVLTALPDGSLNFSISGGSDSGEFAYVSDITQNKVNYVSGVLNDCDILLEIQGQKVAGYTRRDTVAWLNHCCRNGSPVALKTIPAGELYRFICLIFIVSKCSLYSNR